MVPERWDAAEAPLTPVRQPVLAAVHGQGWGRAVSRLELPGLTALVFAIAIQHHSVKSNPNSSVLPSHRATV